MGRPINPHTPSMYGHWAVWGPHREAHLEAHGKTTLHLKWSSPLDQQSTHNTEPKLRQASAEFYCSSRAILRILSESMPKALSKQKLTEIIPTEEELAEAKRDIANLTDKEKNSKKACLKHFLKSFKGDHEDVPKEELLQLFHTHQSRCKTAQKKQSSEKALSVKRSIVHKLRWMSKEQMQRKFGDRKAEHWLNSRLLPTRPDRVTKDWGEWVEEHGCPEDIELYSESELRQMKQEVEAELSQEDAEYFPSLQKRMNGQEFDSIVCTGV